MLVIPHHISYEDSDGNFPAGPVVKNLPTNAGDMGWIPSWTRKIQHSVEQLSTMCHNYWARCSRAQAPQQQKLQWSTTRESQRAATKTQHSQKYIKKKKFK